MKRLIVVMSHKLTPAQVTAAKIELGCEVVKLENQNTQVAKSINPLASFKEVEMLANEIVTDCENLNADCISVMGEPALVTSCAINAQSRGILFAQSTTERTSVDEVQEDGSIKKLSIFRHVQWRKWE